MLAAMVERWSGSAAWPTVLGGAMVLSVALLGCGSWGEAAKAIAEMTEEAIDSDLKVYDPEENDWAEDLTLGVGLSTELLVVARGPFNDAPSDLSITCTPEADLELETVPERVGRSGTGQVVNVIPLQAGPHQWRMEASDADSRSFSFDACRVDSCDATVVLSGGIRRPLASGERLAMWSVSLIEGFEYACKCGASPARGRPIVSLIQGGDTSRQVLETPDDFAMAPFEARDEATGIDFAVHVPSKSEVVVLEPEWDTELPLEVGVGETLNQGITAYLEDDEMVRGRLPTLDVAVTTGSVEVKAEPWGLSFTGMTAGVATVRVGLGSAELVFEVATE